MPETWEAGGSKEQTLTHGNKGLGRTSQVAGEARPGWVHCADQPPGPSWRTAHTPAQGAVRFPLKCHVRRHLGCMVGSLALFARPSGLRAVFRRRSRHCMVARLGPHAPGGCLASAGSGATVTGWIRPPLPGRGRSQGRSPLHPADDPGKEPLLGGGWGNPLKGGLSVLLGM